MCQTLKIVYFKHHQFIIRQLYLNRDDRNNFFFFLNFENGKVMVKECRERPGERQREECISGRRVFRSWNVGKRSESEEEK